jgi:hypothetical protein
MSNNEFTEHFSIFADRSLIHYEHMLLFGDLNFDMLNSDKSENLGACAGCDSSCFHKSRKCEKLTFYKLQI